MIIDRHFQMNKKMHPACILLFSVTLSFPVLGQTGTGENLSNDMRSDQVELDPLVVVASKSPRPLSEIAAQVTVIDVNDIRVEATALVAAIGIPETTKRGMRSQFV